MLLLGMLAAQAVTAMPAAAPRLRIAQDTPIELMALTEVSTATAKPGARIKLRVNRAIEVDGRVVIPVGTPAFGKVETATDAGGLGKSGRMTAVLTHLTIDGVDVPLEGDVSSRGRGSGSAGVAFIFTGVLGLFHRGNNARIKAGEIVAGYVAADVDLPDTAPATTS